MTRYKYFVSYRCLYCPNGTTVNARGKRAPKFRLDSEKTVVDRFGNVQLTFDSPLSTFEQILDAQDKILDLDPNMLEVSIQFYSFLQEEHEEGNHESGPEQEEERRSGFSAPRTRAEKALDGRSVKS